MALGVYYFAGMQEDPAELWTRRKNHAELMVPRTLDWSTANLWPRVGIARDLNADLCSPRNLPFDVFWVLESFRTLCLHVI